jgi:hypothetical protein
MHKHSLAAAVVGLNETIALGLVKPPQSQQDILIAPLAR